MGQYRKKPVVIEAVQFTGQNIAEVWDAFGADRVYGPTELSESAFIDTSEGRMEASPGDWIIRGVKGELYPCKPDIFEATYVAADREPEPVEITDEMVERAAEALWNSREYRDPSNTTCREECSLPECRDYCQHPSADLWHALGERYPADQRDTRADARTILAAALSAPPSEGKKP